MRFHPELRLPPPNPSKNVALLQPLAFSFQPSLYGLCQNAERQETGNHPRHPLLDGNTVDKKGLIIAAFAIVINLMLTGLEAASAAIAGKKAFGQIVEDLYRVGKAATQSALKKWRSTRELNRLSSRIAQVRQVKTLWQVDS